MTMHFYVRKKQLLEQMRVETLEQLEAIRAENVEQFLEKVEKCERIIEVIKQLDASKVPLPLHEEEEIKGLFGEIIHIRRQIDQLLPPLRQKLQQQVLLEQRRERIQRAYGEEEGHAPAIFFDQKN
jgi:hypothetical protein